MLGRKKLKLSEEELYNYAARLLGGRALSTGEVREKLQTRAAEGANIENVIARLREYKFIDDLRFAESYASARRDNQGFGRFRVMQDLRKRRIAPPLAEKASTDAFAEIDEIAQATQYLERKYRSKDLPLFLAEEKNAASVYRRLRMAGFGSGTVIRVLKRYTQRADELEGLEDS